MFDLAGLRAAVATHGRVARVVIAAIKGSSPREVGAAMLVWGDAQSAPGQSGTIGGGVLEFEAAARARELLAGVAAAGAGAAQAASRLDHEALGPKLGQCCGGAVTLLTEVYGAAEVAALPPDVIVRAARRKPMAVVFGPDETGLVPMAVARVLAQARGKGVLPAAGLVQGWMVEPVLVPSRALWVWGAGHVGRALVQVLAPLPEFAITWVDVDAARFPGMVPEGVTVLPARAPAALVPHAPRGAEHLILTYSHALDLELCHRLLGHGFARCGLIGSATKWARFRARLAALGHAPASVARIDCPIGNPQLGKHPQAIALGVAASLLMPAAAAARNIAGSGGAAT